jgi:hypothetical protein
MVGQTKNAQMNAHEKLVSLFHPIYAQFTDCLEFGELRLDMEGAFAHIKVPRQKAEDHLRLISKQRKQYTDKRTTISSKVFIFLIDCMLGCTAMQTSLHHYCEKGETGDIRWMTSP